MPATVIAERVGGTRGLTVFKARVRELRPAYLPPDPASRTTYEAGELAQFDFWFPPIELPVGYGQSRRPKRLPVMTMVSGYSRFAGATLIPSREAPARLGAPQGRRLTNRSAPRGGRTLTAATSGLVVALVLVGVGGGEVGDGPVEHVAACPGRTRSRSGRPSGRGRGPGSLRRPGRRRSSAPEAMVSTSAEPFQSRS